MDKLKRLLHYLKHFVQIPYLEKYLPIRIVKFEISIESLEWIKNDNILIFLNL